MSSVLLALAIVGALPVIAAVFYWAQRLGRGRHLLRFSRTAPIDIVLTTSSFSPAIHGLPVHRPLTGYGQVRAVASCAKALASLYPRKDVRIHLSGFVRNRLDLDLIVIGGPAKNEVARAALEKLVERYEIDRFVFDDVNDHLIVESGIRTFAANGFSPEMVDGYPTSDFGLVIVTNQVGHEGKNYRVVFCAGFTTYGTAAAAEYLLVDMIRLSRLRLYRRLAMRPISHRREFLVVVSARFSRGECTEVQPVIELALRRRERP